MELFSSKRSKGQPVQNMLALVDYIAEPKEWQISRSEVNGITRFQWGLSQQGDGSDTGDLVHRVADADKLRSAFFAVKTEDQAEEFLKACGPFRSDGIEVTWPHFQAWQAYLEKQWKEKKDFGAPPQYDDFGVLNRLIGKPKLDIVQLDTKDGPQVTLMIQCGSAVEAIAGTTWLGKLRQIKVISCGHCGHAFEPGTKRNLFCKQRCAQAAGDQRRAAARGGANGKA